MSAFHGGILTGTWAVLLSCLVITRCLNTEASPFGSVVAVLRVTFYEERLARPHRLSKTSPDLRAVFTENEHKYTPSRSAGELLKSLATGLLNQRTRVWT